MRNKKKKVRIRNYLGRDNIELKRIEEVLENPQRVQIYEREDEENMQKIKVEQSERIETIKHKGFLNGNKNKQGKRQQEPKFKAKTERAFERRKADENDRQKMLANLRVVVKKLDEYKETNKDVSKQQPNLNKEER